MYKRMSTFQFLWYINSTTMKANYQINIRIISGRHA